MCLCSSFVTSCELPVVAVVSSQLCALCYTLVLQILLIMLIDCVVRGLLLAASTDS